MLSGEIILETGERHEFLLDDQEERKLELQVQKMNEYLRGKGEPEDWTLVKELRGAIAIHLQSIPYPEENETPGAATPGESEQQII